MQDTESKIVPQLWISTQWIRCFFKVLKGLQILAFFVESQAEIEQNLCTSLWVQATDILMRGGVCRLSSLLILLALLLSTWSALGKRLWVSISNHLKLHFLGVVALIRSSHIVGLGYLNSHILSYLEKLERLWEVECGKPILPKAQMEDSQVVEVELRVQLLALLVHKVVFRLFIRLASRAAWLVVKELRILGGRVYCRGLRPLLIAGYARCNTWVFIVVVE